MEHMSFWELVKNSPEWVGVFATSVFAAITVLVLYRQVRVMRWQGRNSDRHERTQNRLIQFQLENEWVLRMNAEREKILTLARKLHLVTDCLREREQGGDEIHWEELQDRVVELSERLRILDVRVFSGNYDGKWYAGHVVYVGSVLRAVLDDRKFNDANALTNLTPNLSTRTTLKTLNTEFEPTTIFLDLETAIRMEFSDFKDKWDAALAS
jgi:hypothetical protein